MDDESPRVGAEILAGGTADLKPARVSPAFFGAVPGHPILDRALDDMRPRSQYGHDKAATGSVFFDRLMKHYPDTVSFEAGLFYPSNDDERQRALAVHHRARSWKTDDGLRHAMLAGSTESPTVGWRRAPTREIVTEGRRRHQPRLAGQPKLNRWMGLAEGQGFEPWRRFHV